MLNADKLVDQALRELGFQARQWVKNYKIRLKNLVISIAFGWRINLRNRIAHETNVVVGYDEARYALASF